MKYLLTIFFLIAFSCHLSAQTIISAELQAAGLTCSMCSNAIQKALQSTPFVQKVEPELKTSSFYIEFKDQQSVSVRDIRKAVEDAGFSIASLKIKINDKESLVSKFQPAQVGSQYFCIADIEEWKGNSIIEILIVDRYFLTEKKWNQYQKIISESKCVQASSEKGFMYPAVLIK